MQTSIGQADLGLQEWLEASVAPSTQPVRAHYREVQIDFRTLKALAAYDAPEMIRRIPQQFGVRLVLVGSEEKGLALPSSQGSTEAEATRYYTDYFRSVVAAGIVQAPAGKYFAPYTGNTVQESQSRPYHDGPLLVLREGCPRVVVLHEMLHFLIERARNEPQVDFQGLRVHAETKHLIEGQSLFRLLVQGKSDAISSTLCQGVSASDLEYFLAERLMTLDAQIFGEEIDVTRTLLEHAAELAIPVEEQEHQLAYLFENHAKFESNTHSFLANIEVLRAQSSSEAVASEAQQKFYLQAEKLLMLHHETRAWARARGWRPFLPR
jgi:hypothetical protein